MKFVDFRSDTVTMPTEEMRRAMYEAELGDDVYGEDPTVRKLEELAAQMSGKQAALFTVSGTMGNQAAIAAHVTRGDELICEQEAHIFYYEVAGIAVLSGAQARTIPGDKGILRAADIAEYIRPDDIHQPPTKLICLENTHNRGGGTCYSLEGLAEIKKLADAHNIAVHMDGARVMNAVVATECSLKDIAQYTDSISICLSKGLCAPVGAVIVGDTDFINRARRMRKRFGGGMRQAGVIAAAGIVALEKMVERLAEDHELAGYFAQECLAMDVDVDLSRVQTNIVILNFANAAAMRDALQEKGFKVSLFGPTKIRVTMHRDISREDVEALLMAIKGLI